jgi:hypothetical protein
MAGAEADMDGQMAMQCALIVRALIDAVRSLLALPASSRLPGVIPVYRLVLARPELASDIVAMRWPR